MDGTRERYPNLHATVPNGLVDEHIVIVGIKSQQAERHQPSQTSEHSYHQRLFAHQQWRAFRPACRNIGQGVYPDPASLGDGTAV